MEADLIKINKLFTDQTRNSRQVQSFLKRINSQKANFVDCQKYARELGKILGNVLKKEIVISENENMAEVAGVLKEILPPTYAQNYDLVNIAAKEVQKIIDKKDGVKLGATSPQINKDKIDGIIKNLTEEGIDPKQFSQRIETYTGNLSESFFDDFIQSNAQFRYEIGMGPQIIRISDGEACKWCQSLAGTYEYYEVADSGNDVFRRHENCHCQVIYKNNKSRYMQNAHTKKML